MPMKTVASLIIIVALGTMGYFQIIERLNIADTRIQIMEGQELQLLYQDHQLLTLEAAEEQLNLVDQMDQAALEAAAQVGHQGKLERQIKAAEAALDLTQDHPLIQVAEQADQVLLS